MRIEFKYRLLCFVSALLFSLQLNSQIIAPLSFTPTGIYNLNAHINACVEDSVNNRLYLQNSCVCGLGPAAVMSQICYVNLLNNIIVSNNYNYNPWGIELKTKEMDYSGNSVYNVDGRSFNVLNVPVYSSKWTYSPTAIGTTVVATAIRNDSVFTITSDNYCQVLELRNKNTGALIAFNTIDCSSLINGWLGGDVKVMKIYRNRLYLAGAFQVLDQFSNPYPGEDNITSIDLRTGQLKLLNFNVNDSIKDMEFYNNKIHISGNFTSVNGQTRNYYAMLDTSGNVTPNTPSFNDYVEKIALHDNYLLAMGKFTTINSTTVNPFAQYEVKAVNLRTNSVMNWNMPFAYSSATCSDFMMEKGRYRLFTSNRSFGSFFLEGYCLPPVKSTTVISCVSTTLCEQTSNLTFSVAPFQYASSYNWSYTGTGVTITNTNNIASISFALGATSGKLKMCAISPCGGVSDTLMLNITVYPRPNATASLIDDTLNCFKPKVPLLGNSTTPFASFAWSGPSGYNSSQQNDSTGYHLTGVYILTVTAPITGCTRTVSLLVHMDTLKPNVTLPPGPYVVGCGTSSLITLNGTSTTAPTSLWWKKLPTSPSYTANPVNVSVGNYFLEARNTYNGCIKASPTITVNLSAAMPTVSLTSHTYSNLATPVDTITCITTSVSLSAVFSPTNCTLVWKENSTNTISANPVTVYGNSYHKAIVTRLDNNCVDSTLLVLVDQNITKPNVSILTPSPNINCSSSTTTLNAAFSPTQATAVWTGPFSFSAPNPAITNTQGKYYFTVTRSDNGCSRKDSVNVGYNNTLVVNASNDTTICKNSLATLSAEVTGTTSGITYTWSTGASGQTIAVNPALTTTYVVTANGTAGCMGKDTIVVNIPTDMQDSIVTAKGCAGNNGSLTIYVKGGIAPYKFSVNGSPFTSQITYTNLPFATYSVSIKDSVGCILNTTATISQNSNLNQPVFIVSTQNFKGDTVVFVDLTVPKADSVKWILPSVASIIGGDMYNPVVVFADTGSFPVTLQAFYGTCMTSTTKTIRVLPLDSAYATLSNNNGIKTLNLYPNPNTGQFTVQIEFYKKQNTSIQIWDSQPQKHFQQNFNNADIITLPVNVSQLQNGTYVLRVIGEYASKHIYFVISK